MEKSKKNGIRIEKLKTVEVHEKWRDGWSTPDMFVIDKFGNKTMLREHTLGEIPFVKYIPVNENENDQT